MTDKQPEALRLADALTEKDYPPRRAAAEELRRLHSVNAQLLEALEGLKAHFPTGKDLHEAGWDQANIDEACTAYDEARSAIAAAKEQA